MLTPRRMQCANWPSPIEARVAVARDAEIDQVAVGEVGAGQHRRHAPVHAVEAVRLAEEIGRRLRRAADAGELGDAVRRQRQLEAGLDDRGADRIVAAAGAQRRDRALVVAVGIAERVGRQLRVMQPGLGDVGHRYLIGDREPRELVASGRDARRRRSRSTGHGSALRSGARVTTASMSAIALTMNRAVIGVPS